MSAAMSEEERGYCTEHLGRGQYCLRPAVADVEAVGGGLKCVQHVKGWPASIITWLEEP